MRYLITRIERIDGVERHYERCSVTVDDLEAFRKAVHAEEVHLVYEELE